LVSFSAGHAPTLDPAAVLRIVLRG